MIRKIKIFRSIITIFYAEILTRKVDLCSFFNSETKVKQVKKFVNQLFKVSVEHNIFLHMDVRENTTDLAQVFLYHVEKYYYESEFNILHYICLAA